MLNWLNKNKFQAHLITFVLMVLASVGMVFALHSEASTLIWMMIAVFAAANVLALFTK